MAKLTKRQRDTIETALRAAKRAREYLDRPEIAVARKYTDPKDATTQLHYTRLSVDGSSLYELNKEHGSDIVGLAVAIYNLESLLAEK